MHAKVLLYLFVVQALIIFTASQNCVLRNYGCQKFVCVCNSTYCDYIGPITKLEAPQVLVYTSNKAGLRFDKVVKTFQQSTNNTNKITINHDDHYQTIIGFGGAFTDSNGINILSLSNESATNLLRSLFSEDGIAYNLCRVPMGGTDFSTHHYSYDDGPVDKQLKNFQLVAEDFTYKIPLIKIAQALSNNSLQLISSVWTAPAWIKTNNHHGGNGYVKPNMYQTWADYFVKFLDLYKEQGVEFWGITTSNEPAGALVPWSLIDSISWSPAQMGKWVAENLGPTVRNSSHSSINIVALDDQRFFLPWFVQKMFENEKAKDYIDGVGVHWYFDPYFPPSLLSDTHFDFPDKFIIGTEACAGQFTGVDLGSWREGEEYGKNIIQDLQHWVSGWIEWNMVLDLEGGPVNVPSDVDAAIIVNATADEFYKQPMHYVLGHFSKFIPRGSIRLGIVNPNDVKMVAFDRPDEGTVVVVLNDGNKQISITLVDPTRGELSLDISPYSITSVLYW